jgi:endonuclease YncB( thermonuclease family)
VYEVNTTGTHGVQHVDASTGNKNCCSMTKCLQFESSQIETPALCSKLRYLTYSVVQFSHSDTHLNMPWSDWLWSFGTRNSDDQTKRVPSIEPLLPQTEHSSTSSRTARTYSLTEVTGIVALTVGSTIGTAWLYRSYLRRIPNIDHIQPHVWRKRSLYGYVTRVGDGDNFHLYHTPGGRLAGWGWMSGRKVHDLKPAELKGQTISVRIAGIDAPECAHFGKPAQPYGPEALEWLKGYIQHRYVRAYLYSRDQYGRVVATTYRRKWMLFRSDVGLEMLKRGLATVYEAKFGSEFGGKEEKYRKAEERAKRRAVGMWNKPGLVGSLLGRREVVETPREFKTRTAEMEVGGKGSGAVK